MNENLSNTTGAVAPGAAAPETMNTEHEPHYGKYIRIWVVLLFLTAITIGASHFQLGKLNIWISLAIATTKASLVVLYFMHLKDEDLVFKYMFLSACAIMAIFIGMTLFDVAWR